VRVIFVIGTRPEAIKVAPVVFAMRASGLALDPWLCSTGQHREMLDQTLDEFGLRADLDLALMRPDQGLATFASRAIDALDQVIAEREPALVLVQGDTTTALAGALAGFYRQVPVAHLEAGLRSGDLTQPFPEEGNRRAIARFASLHFAPTRLAADNLRREGVDGSSVFVTGNTVIDALEYALRRLPLPVREGGRRRILLTIHRRESHGRPLEAVLGAVRRVVDRNPQLDVTVPVHRSPKVREAIRRRLQGHPRIRLTDALGYRAFVRELRRCDIVLTDSGGVQEEAPALGKPVLVLRETTERPEALWAGTSRLVGRNPDRIVDAVERLLHEPGAYEAMAHAENPFGDGHAARRVVSAIGYHLGLQARRPREFRTASSVPRSA
jgi:UDP-N-acetylglucosamine 2-epimerase (non-hydrolysing)